MGGKKRYHRNAKGRKPGGGRFSKKAERDALVLKSRRSIKESIGVEKKKERRAPSPKLREKGTLVRNLTNYLKRMETQAWAKASRQTRERTQPKTQVNNYCRMQNVGKNQ